MIAMFFVIAILMIIIMIIIMITIIIIIIMIIIIIIIIMIIIMIMTRVFGSDILEGRKIRTHECGKNYCAVGNIKNVQEVIGSSRYYGLAR